MVIFQSFFEKVVFDVLGIKLQTKEVKVSQEILNLAEERKQARDEKDFEKSDELRDKIKELGFEIKDVKDGYELVKI